MYIFKQKEYTRNFTGIQIYRIIRKVKTLSSLIGAHAPLNAVSPRRGLHSSQISCVPYRDRGRFITFPYRAPRSRWFTRYLADTPRRKSARRRNYWPLHARDFGLPFPLFSLRYFPSSRLSIAPFVGADGRKRMTRFLKSHRQLHTVSSRRRSSTTPWSRMRGDNSSPLAANTPCVEMISVFH